MVHWIPPVDGQNHALAGVDRYHQAVLSEQRGPRPTGQAAHLDAQAVVPPDLVRPVGPGDARVDAR